MTMPVITRRLLPTVSPVVWRALTLAGFVGLTALVVSALRNIDWTKTLSALHDARYGWIAVAVLANTAILPCWALFWRSLRPSGEPSVSFGRLLEVTSMSSALMNTLPLGGGHASSIVLLIKRGNTSRRGALSILALDQLGEGVLKVAILVGASLVMPIPRSEEHT